MRAQLPFINLGLRDASGSTASVDAWIRAGSAATAAQAGADVLAARVGALSHAVVYRYSLVYRSVADPRADPASTSQAARAGVFVFSGSEPNTYAVISVPSIRPEVLLTTGPGAGVLIDPAHPDVSGFVDQVVTGLWCNPFGVDLVALEAAYLQWRP